MSKLLHRRDQRGFTILELMIATMVFSVILLGATTALLQIGKLYYKGVVSGRTQETSRGIIDQISQQLQFSSDQLLQAPNKAYTLANPAGGTTTLTFKAFCVGSTRYSYMINAQVSNTSVVPSGDYVPSTNRMLHALWRDSVAGGTCLTPNLSLLDPSTTAAPYNGSNGSEMLAENMRLSALDAQPCTNSNICQISVGVIYGDSDLLAFNATGTPTGCQNIIGSQWCAASQFSTSVLKRVGN